MAKCEDCDSVDVVWGYTKSGKKALYNKAPQLHIITCAARKKKQKPAIVDTSNDLLHRETVNALVAMGYKAKEAKEMLADVNGARTWEEAVEQAIRARGKAMLEK